MASRTFEEAVATKARHEGTWLGLPGVTGVDVGQRRGPAGAEPVISVYVESMAKAPPLPDAVDGVPLQVVERRFKLHRD